MSAAPRFTVVIACYQTAPYLAKALGSVARQTFADFEAICYVEESTDGSLDICRAWAERDARFTVVSAPKSGAVATTRNYGIDHAAGDYLVVLDGDDWIAEDALAELARKLAQTGPVDVLAFAAVTTESETVDAARAPRLTNFRPADAEGVFTGLAAIRKAGRNGAQMRNFTWLNAYRTDFLRAHKLRQTDGVLMEDLESTPRIWFAADRVAYLDRVLYFYRRRPGSLTTEASPRIARHLAQQIAALMDFLSAADAPDDIQRIWSNQWLGILCWFLFHPVTSHKISDADRRAALATVLAGGRRQAFRALAAHASRPKRIAVPLLLLAAKGWTLPARLFFRKLYYPLVERRTAP